MAQYPRRCLTAAWFVVLILTAWGSMLPSARAQGLVGPPDEPANAHIPEIPFPEPALSDYTFIAPSLALSFREILLVFDTTATVQQANDLLGSINASVIGGYQQGTLLLISVPLTDLNEMTTLLTALNANPLVEFALMETAGVANILPHLDLAPDWGLKFIRAPQMWNLDTFVRRNTVETDVSAGIIDDGFGVSHFDLSKLKAPAGTIVKDHGTMVAGIIGADFNSVGVTGINPWLDSMHARAFPAEMATFGRISVDILQLLREESSIKAVNNSWGMNYLALSGGSPFVDPAFEFGDKNGDGDHADDHEFAPVDMDAIGGNDSWAEVMDHWGELVARRVGDFINGAGGLPGIRGDFFLVAAAGNDGVAYRARDSNPIGNAAERFGNNFLSVGSIDRQNSPSSHSTRGASVYAPGEDIRSTTATGLGTASGTSLAAPYVTGLITALWKLGPGLSVDDIRRLITDPGHTTQTSNGLPVIDAFAAAIGIDQIQGTTQVQRALVDIDDGSIDGNLRVEPGSGTIIDVIFTSDSLRGDGTIDMKDFRVFRDALLQILVEQGKLNPDQLALDGNPAHFKKDLNFDGCAATILEGATIAAPASPPHPAVVPTPDACAPIAENIFPRYDFNGSGRVDPEGRLVAPGPDGVAPFKIDPDVQCSGLGGGCVRDVDVLASSGWTVDSEGVSVDSADEGVVEDVLGQWRPKRDLLADRDQDGEIDYLRSADIHLTFLPGNPDRLHEFAIFVASELPEDIEAANGDCPDIDELPFAFRRCINVPAPRVGDDEVKLIITVPLWTGKVVVDMRTIADPPLFMGLVNKHIDLKMGEDFHFEFGPIELEPSVSATWDEFESFISTEVSRCFSC